jgi:hypothetical protein
MSINRALWEGDFTVDDIPLWPCPGCEKGVLRLLTSGLQDKIVNYECDEDGVYNWAEYTYSAVFGCSNEQCQSHVASTGQGQLKYDHNYFDENGHPSYIVRFAPEFFYPALKIFTIPSHVTNCPSTVLDEIYCSFKLFFCDPAATLNRIRRGVEIILNHAGVKRFQIANGRRRLMSLHQRILHFRSKNADVADRLFAIKWLGNAGSHPGEITKSDVLDAYEIMESVLENLYSDREKLIKQKVVLVNKRKGPIRNKKGR